MAADFFITYFSLLMFCTSSCSTALHGAQVHQESREASPECSTIVGPKMKVLPGRGWDLLTDKEMGQVLKMDYSSCRTTTDDDNDDGGGGGGGYIIPDNVVLSAAATNTNGGAELIVDVFEHWSQYKSVTSEVFDASSDEPREVSSLFSTFSDDFQAMKMLQINRNSTTIRVSLRQKSYDVAVLAETELHEQLKSLFREVSEEVLRNNTRKVDLMLEIILEHYGTHYVDIVDMGTVLYQDQYISMEFYLKNKNETEKLKYAASVIFNATVNGSKDASGLDEHQEFLEAYEKHMTAAYSNIMEQRLGKSLTTIARYGKPISSLLTPKNLPNVSPQTIAILKAKYADAISRYYAYNTRKGCNDPTSKYFDVTSNVKDLSCQRIVVEGATLWSRHYFGGLFQMCNDSMSSDASSELCHKLGRKNPLTGEYSCPQGYIPVNLTTINKSSYHCQDTCTGWPLFQKCHKDCNVIRAVKHCRSEVKLHIYWCVNLMEELPHSFIGLEESTPPVISIHTQNHKAVHHCIYRCNLEAMSMYV